MPDQDDFRATEIDVFDRNTFGRPNSLQAIGGGEIGGKASGLVRGRRILLSAFPEGTHRGIEVNVPALAVIPTLVFDAFLERNDLMPWLAGEDRDERISHRFQQASFPTEMVGDLHTVISSLDTPLAVRSSSLLEDATHEPFAGVYGTKMVPNRHPTPAERFRELIGAVKFVYASTFFRDARGFRLIAGRKDDNEKMSVVVQEVVGRRFGDRFYPTVSGVVRSFNCYPSGPAKSEEGVVELALGLGKTIVDGPGGFAYSPSHPRVGPPLTTSDLLKQTQTKLWAVNLARSTQYDPMGESEFLVSATLADAEADGTLTSVASTFDAENDRLVPGIGRAGPRVLNFAPILHFGEPPLNEVVKAVLARCEDALGEVEIEFALSLDPTRRDPPRFGFLQVRPIVVSREDVHLEDADFGKEGLFAASSRALGHGRSDTIEDIVYMKPSAFDKAETRRIGQQVGILNRSLRAAGRKYLLVCFGRLGSSDPWLGVPVDWEQISEVATIVEATLPDMDVDLSQGSHFFHNLSSLKIPYFNVHHAGPHRIDWAFVDSLPAVEETEFLRHVRLPAPLRIRVDGRTGRGVIER